MSVAVPEQALGDYKSGRSSSPSCACRSNESNSRSVNFGRETSPLVEQSREMTLVLKTYTQADFH